LAGNTAVPKLLPGHIAPVLGKPTSGKLVLNPPAPPPWVELAMLIALHIGRQRQVLLRIGANPLRLGTTPKHHLAEPI